MIEEFCPKCKSHIDWGEICYYCEARKLEAENKALKEKVEWAKVDYKSFRRRYDALEKSRDELLEAVRQCEHGEYMVYVNSKNVSLDSVIQKALKEKQ